jgi:hypothetical protein
MKAIPVLMVYCIVKEKLKSSCKEGSSYYTFRTESISGATLELPDNHTPDDIDPLPYFDKSIDTAVALADYFGDGLIMPTRLQ